MPPQRIDLPGIDRLQVPAQRREHHLVWLDREEGVGDLDAPRVLVVEGRDERGRLAGRVELEVDESCEDVKCQMMIKLW
jgi:hypothetical protein